MQERLSKSHQNFNLLEILSKGLRAYLAMFEPVSADTELLATLSPDEKELYYNNYDQFLTSEERETGIDPTTQEMVRRIKVSKMKARIHH